MINWINFGKPTYQIFRTAEIIINILNSTSYLNQIINLRSVLFWFHIRNLIFIRIYFQKYICRFHIICLWFFLIFLKTGYWHLWRIILTIQKILWFLTILTEISIKFIYFKFIKVWLENKDLMNNRNEKRSSFSELALNRYISTHLIYHFFTYC